MLNIKILILAITLLTSYKVEYESNNSMSENWKTYKKYLEDKLPVYFKRLNPPATNEEIEELENQIGSELPEEFKALYKLNNGEQESWFNGGVMCGMRMFTLSQIKAEIKKLKEIEDQFNFNSKWNGDITPEGTIKSGAYYEKWIPIFSDNNGNFIGLDLDPDSEGVYGQVINFGTDEYDHFIISKSLVEFVDFINKQFENGRADKAIFENDNGENVMFGLAVESHLTDDLREIKK
ncbi:Cell wall assembly regulator SMI1 [Marivirga sericea]|uniref:Cell wall assembly regulator SMI1 n=1 Tax=Marivirga sericea TaxID=1028 RepID=A0A1X7L8V4_9BACT|nr:SMI1/KNR4 family protein [Marivirga sericea]SMG49987.1 Cell wall assembly regulator SMI1 [Marivirga sericea]